MFGVQASRGRYLFLIGHMRAYSTLVGHILGSHPNICGYYEHHKRYKNWQSLFKLRRRLKNEFQGKKICNIYFDKLLHNGCELRPAILKRRDIRCLFSIRNPESSIRSILNMWQKLSSGMADKNVSDAVSYYCGRIEEVARLSREIIYPENSVYFPAESVVDDTEKFINKLSAWLELEVRLSGEFERFEHTGKEGYGDPSGYIQTGKVIKQRDNYTYIEIPGHLLDKANDVYERTNRIILENIPKL